MFIACPTKCQHGLPSSQKQKRTFSTFVQNRRIPGYAHTDESVFPPNARPFSECVSKVSKLTRVSGVMALGRLVGTLRPGQRCYKSGTRCEKRMSASRGVLRARGGIGLFDESRRASFDRSKIVRQWPDTNWTRPAKTSSAVALENRPINATTASRD